jgi:Spy/CpxP family protein refolding chaperone
MTLHTKLSTLLAAALLSTCLLAAPAVLAQAMPPADDHDPGPGFQQADGCADGPFDPAGPFPPFGPGAHAGPASLRGLDLSEAQQDRVFAILHAQAPKRRELEKAERKAGQALGELARAPELDEARASASAQALGQAIADQEVLRLRTNAQIKAVLTSEQRARLDRPRGEQSKGRADKKGVRAKQREAGK